MADKLLTAPAQPPSRPVEQKVEKPPEPEARQAPRKFTNLEGKAGTDGWEFVPPITQDEKESMVVRTRPEGVQAPPKFPSRKEFEDNAFEALGGNPFEVDPVQAVTAASKDLQPLFNYVFKNKIFWGDRERLSEGQREFWDSTVKAYRSQIFNEAKSKRATDIDVYNQMMTRYDNEFKENDMAQRRIASERKAVFSAAKGKRVEERAEENLAISQRREERLQKSAEETSAARKAKGSKQKEPSRSDISAIVKFEERLFDPEIYEEGAQIGEADLRDWNRMRKASGLPEVDEIVAGSGDFEQHQYIERPESAQEAESVEVDVPADATESEFDLEVKRQHPQAFKHGEQWYMLDPDTGNFTLIEEG